MSRSAIAASGLKFASTLRQSGVRKTIRHYRTVTLHHAHTAFDRRFHPRARDDLTAGKAELEALTIAGPHRATGVHYLPTPWRILDWVHDELPTPDPRATFIDYGCGKGRAVISAAARPYGRVIGVEFAAELAATAHDATRRFARGARSTIEIHEGDATLFPIPPTPIVAFLFNPFGPPVIDRVAAALSRAWIDHRQPIVLAYLNPVHQRAFADAAGFTRVPLSTLGRLRFAFASPYRLSLFATREVRGFRHHAKRKGGHRTAL